MKLGLQLNSFDWTGGPERFGATLAEIAGAAEETGFDRIGVADHLWQHPIMGGPVANEPECYTTLSFVAANTERVKLTAMVTGGHFRHRVFWPRPSPRWMSSPAVVPGSVSGLVITRKRLRVSGSRFLRKRSVSRCSRRRSR